MASKKTTELVKSKPMNKVTTFDNVPDYLKEHSSSGMEGLGSADFKIPRVKLLQALTPEVRTHPGKAIPGEFWHTAANKSLGDSFKMVACVASKRVILFNPREAGGGILAFSPNGKDWVSGAKSTFEVTIKGCKEKIVYKTGKDVPSSKLLDWGSSMPGDSNSAPAATLIYEYLCYLPDQPQLSPCVLGIYKTGLSNAKNFNTSLLMLRKPTASVLVEVSATEQSSDGNTWFVPTLTPNGFVSKEIFDVTNKMAEGYKSYQADYTDITSEDVSSSTPTEY